MREDFFLNLKLQSQGRLKEDFFFFRKGKTNLIIKNSGKFCRKQYLLQ